MAREKYQGMYDSSMSGLERSRRQTAEAIKEAEARKKEEAENTCACFVFPFFFFFFFF